MFCGQVSAGMRAPDRCRAVSARTQMLNEVLNLGLKRVLSSARPAGSDRDDSGMPSNHTQFMFFFFAYAALFLLRRCASSSSLVLLPCWQ